MKHSIKKQLIVNFAAIFITVTLAFILCDFILLKNFFVLSKYRNIQKVYETANLAASDYPIQSQVFLLSFRKACMENNINGLVMDEDGNTIVSLEGAEFVPSVVMDRGSVKENGGSEKKIKETTDYTIKLITYPSESYSLVELTGQLPGGETVLLRSSLASVKNAVRVSNTFLLVVTMLGVIIGIIAILIVSRRITKPVLELTQISDKMANLDFEAKYEGNGDNEIDRLGLNMNRVSEKLENTLDELKEANSELKKDIEKKEEIEMMRREFVANASHELKTPIALIQGYAEGLKEGISEDPENRDYYCEVIMDEASKMNELVKQLMNLHELEMGGRELHPEEFEISEMISNQTQTMSVLAQNKGVTIEYDKEKEIVVSDALKAEEVYRNFLSNAITHADGEKKVRITTSRMDDILRINVFNTGKPIPEESLDKIWDKFYKVDKASVGLSIVKATMELLGGNYGFENKENGVLFFFELPRKK